MAIHERDPFGTPADQPPWPHLDDDDAFTTGCPECDAARAILSIEADLRYAVRDLWIAGWTPADIADDVRHRTGSIDARDLVVHALLADDAERSDQARTEAWTKALTLLGAASAVAGVEAGWVAGWISERNSRDASETLIDALDVLHDMERSVS